ncbi:hypothetical protein WJX75_004918 [Coccomyxa subellipsoidea]|uniref:Uncharacterized protein n=1 Tax=Coccomyxa subellipsoidea TaxID=248742 RepID=A0ABR2YY60_9CHLO
MPALQTTTGRPTQKSVTVGLHRYVLAHFETYQGVQRGDRVWRLGFGAGFKRNSAVWRAVRPIRDRHLAWVTKEDCFIAARAAKAADN